MYNTTRNIKVQSSVSFSVFLGEEMKVVNIIGKVFCILLYLLVIVLGVSIALVLAFGLKLYSIQTGSMEPSYPVGMMIVVEPVSFDQLSNGDVITFVTGDNTVVTHRVVGIDKETQQLTTKGDNNNVSDASPVSYKNVIGRVKFGIPGVGYFILILNTTFGKWMLALAVVALIGIEIIRRMYYHDKYEAEAEENQTDSFDDVGNEHSEEQKL